MRILIFLRRAAVLLAVLGAAYSANAQAYQWATGAMVPANSGWNALDVQATAIDPTGNVYTAYRHTTPLTTGGQVWPGTTNGALSIVKYDANGQVAGALLNANKAQVLDLATDAAGNVYALGVFTSTVARGGVVLTSASGFPDWFVGKWNASGGLEWLRQGVVTTNDSTSWYLGAVLAVDAAGNVTVAGSGSGDIRFGTSVISIASNSSSMFVVQFNASGTVRWSRASVQPAQAQTIVRGMAVDATTGALILVGWSQAAGFSWDGRSIVAPNSQDKTYWLRLSDTGTVLASFSIDGMQYVHIAAADNGHSFLGLSSNQVTADFSLNGPIIAAQAQGVTLNVLARLDPSGVPQWTKTLTAPVGGPLHASSLKISVLTATVSAGSSVCYLGGEYATSAASLSLGGAMLPITDSSSADGYVAALDGLTGTMYWALPAGGGGASASVYQLSVSPSGQLALAGTSWSLSNLPLTFGPTISITYPASGRTPNAFTAKLLPAFNLLRGAAFTDANLNGVFDANEAPYEGLIVQEQPGGSFRATDAAGAYAAAVGLGIASVSVPVAPLYHTATRVGPASATFATYGNQAVGYDFAVRPVPNQQDVRVVLTMVGRARPGFPVKYRVTYRNVGTVALATGNVTLVLSTRLTYLSNTGGATLNGPTLTTAYTNLLPGQTRNFDVVSQLPTNAVLGAQLLSTATVTPVVGDLTTADNTQTDVSVITGSFDPNDISVNFTTLTPTQVQNGEWLEYTIRFQNMGTDTAFSVLLRDSLPTARLNLGTLQLLAASHNCAWNLGARGLLSVQFTSIRLPHRAVNTVGSMGFVRFRVKPVTALALGDLIPNQAAIYFDFNAPVATNTALTQIESVTGVGTARAEALAGGAWPNPADGVLTVETTLPTAGTLRVTLLDVVGRPVLHHALTAAAGPVRERLDVAALPAGLYLLRAETDGQHFTRRVVIK